VWRKCGKVGCKTSLSHCPSVLLLNRERIGGARLSEVVVDW